MLIHSLLLLHSRVTFSQSDERARNATQIGDSATPKSSVSRDRHHLLYLAEMRRVMCLCAVYRGSNYRRHSNTRRKTHSVCWCVCMLMRARFTNHHHTHRAVERDNKWENFIPKHYSTDAWWGAVPGEIHTHVVEAWLHFAPILCQLMRLVGTALVVRTKRAIWDVINDNVLGNELIFCATMLENFKMDAIILVTAVKNRFCMSKNKICMQDDKLK